jgi:hypothetical protein
LVKSIKKSRVLIKYFHGRPQYLFGASETCRIGGDDRRLALKTGCFPANGWVSWKEKMRVLKNFSCAS